MPREWTPEARAALGEKMRARHAAKNAAATKQVIEDTVEAFDAALNPIATDVVTAPRTKLKSAPKRPAVEVIESQSPLFVASLVTDLSHIPLDVISYDECGTLLNALSAASTAVALARRQRQEQLEAGSHRAPCKTCGRMIDISKPGGFQILTERDEHWQPRNSYYCSQNCLLARNMPSHAKSTPRQKQVNQA